MKPTALMSASSARMGFALKSASNSAQVSRANFFRSSRGLSGGRTPLAWSSFFIAALSAFSRRVRRFFFVGITSPPQPVEGPLPGLPVAPGRFNGHHLGDVLIAGVLPPGAVKAMKQGAERFPEAAKLASASGCLHQHSPRGPPQDVPLVRRARPMSPMCSQSEQRNGPFMVQPPLAPASRPARGERSPAAPGTRSPPG